MIRTTLAPVVPGRWRAPHLHCRMQSIAARRTGTLAVVVAVHRGCGPHLHRHIQRDTIVDALLAERPLAPCPPHLRLLFAPAIARCAGWRGPQRRCVLAGAERRWPQPEIPAATLRNPQRPGH